MLGFLRSWILSVVIMVLFLILVSMVLPSNGLKKYSKFVTGLIVIIVIMTPVFKIFSKNLNVETFISTYNSYINDTDEKTSRVNLEDNINKRTLDIFKENLKTEIEYSIKDGSNRVYKVTELEINEDTKDKNFGVIKYIELRHEGEQAIKPVEKVSVGKEEKKTEKGSIDREVLAILAEKFKVDSKIVKFIK